MTYTSRKQTPLKYNALVKYIFLPLAAAVSGYFTFMMIAGYFNLPIIGVRDFVRLFRSATLINLTSPGAFWLPIVRYTAALLVLTVLVLTCLAGMLKWKRYGKNLWLALNTVWTAVLVYAAYYLVSVTDFLTGSGFAASAAFVYGLDQTELITMMKMIRVALIVVAVLAVVFLIMNYVYYYKRRKLFVPFYAEPLQEPVSVSEPTEEVQETVSENGTVIPVDVKAADPDAVKTVAKLLYCPNCGRRLTDEDINFCTACGARLKED